MKMDKAKVENCIAKTRAFYDTKAVGCALLKVKNIATLPSPALSLTDYTFPDDVYKYLDARAQCTIERLAQRAELADDTVPAEGPWYGIAEHRYAIPPFTIRNTGLFSSIASFSSSPGASSIA